MGATRTFAEMENIPHPSDDSYVEGDLAHIYTANKDFDAGYHGLVCEVIENEPDELDELPGREIGSRHYQLRRKDSGELLPVWFRHSYLVPAAEWPRHD